MRALARDGVIRSSIAVVYVVAILVHPVYSATFIWDRTSQVMSETSNVSGTSQGVPFTSTSGGDPSTNDVAASNVSDNMTNPVPGGAGGEGGDGLPNDGANGTAGATGEAASTSSAEGIGQLNADLQPAMNWAWIHDVWPTLDLQGAGGGGGGGGGGSDGRAGALNGGPGGTGDSANGSVLGSQSSQVDVTATVGIAEPIVSPPPYSALESTVRFRVDILWGDSGLGQRFNWNRSINLVIDIGPGPNSPAPPPGQLPPTTTLTFTTDGEGVLNVSGVKFDGFTTSTFSKSSTTSLNGNAGSFGIGLSEFSNLIRRGDVMTFRTIGGGAPGAFSSVDSGVLGANGSLGGGGGQGGQILGTNGAHGHDAGSGAAGGAGGLGIDGGGRGGNGGRGATGGTLYTDNPGMSQGTTEVWLDPNGAG